MSGPARRLHGALEGGGPAYLFERPRGADDAVRFEVRGRAFQAVRGAPQRLAVALFDRFANLFEMTWRIVDEQAC